MVSERVSGQEHGTEKVCSSGKKLLNSYLRLTSQIYPCPFGLIVPTLEMDVVVDGLGILG